MDENKQAVTPAAEETAAPTVTETPAPAPEAPAAPAAQPLSKKAAKTAREAEQRKAEKRTNTLYAIIAVLFVIAGIAAVVWRTNLIQRTVPAVTINGKGYSATEVSYYYDNLYSGFTNQYSYFTSYLGLDTTKALDEQAFTEDAASLLGVEYKEGQTWKDFFLDQTCRQIVTTENAMAQAAAEGFQAPADAEEQFKSVMESVESNSAASGITVDTYLKSTYGAGMNRSTYEKLLRHMIDYSYYCEAYENGLKYTEEQLEAKYQEDPRFYDNANYSYVFVDGSVLDAEAEGTEPSEEESAAAMEAARVVANDILAAYKSGESLSELADRYDNASYYANDAGTYGGDALTEWVFDPARQAGDADVIESGNYLYVAVFNDRWRDEGKTVNIRHILIQPETGELTADDEGYEAEQEELKAAAHAKAEEIYQQWLAGDKTEGSFAALAMEYSADGNAADGGIYEGVYEGQMVQSFNDWCFDSARKPGDSGIVDTAYGSHIIYFISDGQPRWMVNVEDTLRGVDYSNWVSDMSGDYEVKYNSFGMGFVE